jgi:hypothetical protein
VHKPCRHFITNCTARFLLQKLWSLRDRKIEVSLARDEVDVQRLVGGGEIRGGEECILGQFAVSRKLDKGGVRRTQANGGWMRTSMAMFRLPPALVWL